MVTEAENQLPELIARAEAGEAIVIAGGRGPVAKLAATRQGHRRVFGSFKGKFRSPPNAFFFDLLPED